MPLPETEAALLARHAELEALLAHTETLEQVNAIEQELCAIAEKLQDLGFEVL